LVPGCTELPACRCGKETSQVWTNSREEVTRMSGSIIAPENLPNNELTFHTANRPKILSERKPKFSLVFLSAKHLSKHGSRPHELGLVSVLVIDVSQESRVVARYRCRSKRVRTMEQNKVSLVVMGGSSSALKDWVTDVDLDTCDICRERDIDRRVLGQRLRSWISPAKPNVWRRQTLSLEPKTLILVVAIVLTYRLQRSTGLWRIASSVDPETLRLFAFRAADRARLGRAGSWH
jgi:hypothetical protein